jgi:hypothetical protein
MPTTLLRCLGDIVKPDDWLGQWTKRPTSFVLNIDADRTATIFLLSSHKRPADLPITAALIIERVMNRPLGYGYLKGFPEIPLQFLLAGEAGPGPAVGGNKVPPDPMLENMGRLALIKQEETRISLVKSRIRQKVERVGDSPEVVKLKKRLEESESLVAFYKMQLVEVPKWEPPLLPKFGTEQEKMLYLLSGQSYRDAIDKAIVSVDVGKYAQVNLKPEYVNPDGIPIKVPDGPKLGSKVLERGLVRVPESETLQYKARLAINLEPKLLEKAFLEGKLKLPPDMMVAEDTGPRTGPSVNASAGRADATTMANVVMDEKVGESHQLDDPSSVSAGIDAG